MSQIRLIAKGIVRGLHTMVNFPFTLVSGGEEKIVEEITKKVRQKRLTKIDIIAFDRRAMTLIDLAFAVHIEPEHLRRRGGLTRFGNVCRGYRGTARASDIMEAFTTRLMRQDWLEYPLSFERLELNYIGIISTEHVPELLAKQVDQPSDIKHRLETTGALEVLSIQSGVKHVDGLKDWLSGLIKFYNDSILKVAEDNPHTAIIAEENVLAMSRREGNLEWIEGAKMTMETEVQSILHSMSLIRKALRTLHKKYMRDNPRLQGYRVFTPDLRAQKVARVT